MPSTEEASYGVGVCEDCGTIQPVEVRPDDGIRATGNPVCECGSNRFSLVEQVPGVIAVESVALEADTVSEVTGPLA